jgi:hypothetical protein
METLESMRAFARVAELGSFTRAADELGLSRAMVSTHVRRLERRFGLKLLNERPAGRGLPAVPTTRHCRCVFAENRRSRGKPGSFGRRSAAGAARFFGAVGIDLDLRFNERVDLIRENVDLAGGPARSPTRTWWHCGFPARAGSPAPRPSISKSTAVPSRSRTSPITF